MTVYKAFRIHNDDQGYRAGIEELPVTAPGAGEVLIRVAYSSVNYRDALAGTGRGKILATFPLVGGVDAAGSVETSADGRFTPGDPVLVTGYGLSYDHDGGYARYLKVPGDWVVPMPVGLDPRNAMLLGSAGFTVALAIHRMQVNEQRPELGPVLVTGASGGVGSIAVDIFRHLGYEPAAVSGKPERHDWLRELGAAQILGRDELPGGERPLEQAVWGGALDSVGGRDAGPDHAHRQAGGQYREHRARRRLGARHYRHAFHPARGESARHQLPACAPPATHPALVPTGDGLAAAAPGTAADRYHRPGGTPRCVRRHAGGKDPRADTRGSRRLLTRCPVARAGRSLSRAPARGCPLRVVKGRGGVCPRPH